MNKHILFEVLTPIDLVVEVSRQRWEVIISIKHPAMFGAEDLVSEVLSNPNQIRRSRRDSNILLFYKAQRHKRWICAVVKRLNDKATLVTAYPTNAIKVGDVIWTR